MPPPVTPSPHRFVIKKEAAPVRRTPLTQSYTPRRPSTRQFNATPRFNFSSTPRPTPSQPAPASTRFSTPAPKVPKAQDLIEDLSSDDPPYDLHRSIENDDYDIHEEDLAHESADENNDYRIGEPLPKRRRFTSPLLLDDEDAPRAPEDEDDDRGPLEDEETNNEHEAELPSSSIPSVPSPAYRKPIPSNHHRFVLSTPAPQTTQAHSTPQANFLKPPRFLPPDLSEASTSDPLPQHFSPHRKGHKYIPGGLASEVRDWLTNLSSAIPSTKNKDDPWVVKIVVDEISGGGRADMTLVKGRRVLDGEMLDHLGFVRVMLAGEGQKIGLQRSIGAEVGKVVGIKGPVWEVVIEDEKWGVGVEWKVLS